jgi:hypothetical protein
MREVEIHIHNLFAVHGTPAEVLLSHTRDGIQIAIKEARRTFSMEQGFDEKAKKSIDEWLVPLIKVAVGLGL